MKRNYAFFRIALYNILNNKAYSIFSVLSTVFVFVFVMVVLQLAQNIAGNNAPQAKAGRTVRLEGALKDKQGGVLEVGTENGIRQISKLVQGYEALAISYPQMINTTVNGRANIFRVNFVNADFWRINDFQFIAGRPFDKEPEGGQLPVAVVTEAFVNTYLKGMKPLGQKLELQQNTYEIAGVVKDFPITSVNNDILASIWVPARYNKFFPVVGFYTMHFLFPDQTPGQEMKKKVATGVRTFFEEQNQTVEIKSTDVFTIREVKMQQFGGNLLMYGVGGILLILLVIPAVNIVTLSLAHTSNQKEELAIRRAVGATQRSVFFHVMMENFLLILIGIILGLIILFPVFNGINYIADRFTDIGWTVLANTIYIKTFLVVIPLIVLFGFLSGGLPAYVISRSSIADILKGGGAK